MNDPNAPTDSRVDRLPPVAVLNYDHLGVILWGEESLDACLDEQIRRLQKYPRFKIGWDHDAYSYDYLAANVPALLERMQQTVARLQGRIAVGSCTYSQPLARHISGESNIRQLVYAIHATEQHFGSRPTIFLSSEHAFHAQLPQLLTACGFDGVLLRTHFMMYGYNPEIGAAVVWWEGADGTAIKTVPTYRGQQATKAVPGKPTPYGNVTLDNRILTDFAREDVGSLEQFREQFGPKISPLVASRADDPRQPEEIIEWHHEDRDYCWYTAEELFAKLPVPRQRFTPRPEEFQTRMPWGYCGNRIWARERRCETRLLTVEMLAAIGSELAPADETNGDFEAELHAAWRSLLVTQHHDIQILGLEEAADHYFSQAEEIIDRAIDHYLLLVSRRVGATTESRQVVFNPLGWRRQALVEDKAGELVAVEVPTLGFTTVQKSTQTENSAHQELTWDTTNSILRTPHYTAQFGPDGGIAALQSVDGKHDWLARDVSVGNLTGLVDGKECVASGRVRCEMRNRDARISEVGRVGSIGYEQQWRFYSHSKRVDWNCTLNIDEQRIGRSTDDERDPHSAFEHEHKLRLKFFPALASNRIGVEHQPFLMSETADKMLQGIYWSAVTDGKLGWAVFNRGSRGVLQEPDGGFSIPLAFSMHYIWNTVWLRGSYQFELAFLPFRGDWREARLHKNAMEYNFPALRVTVDGLEDSYGESRSPLEYDEDKVCLTSLFRDRGTLYARFFEHEGAGKRLTLTWNGRAVDLVETDLQLRELAPIGNTLHFAPWEVKTVQFRTTGKQHTYPESVERRYPDPPANDWRDSRWFLDNK